MNLDFLQAIKYIFEDKEWPKKIGVATVLLMAPIVNVAVVGYQVEVVRNVRSGKEDPLPDWNDFGDKFILGLPLALFNIVLCLPLLLLGFVMSLVFFGSFFFLVESSNNLAPGALIALVVIGLALFGLYAVYMLLWTFLHPAWLMRYAITGDWHSFFQIRKLLSFIRERLGTYLVAVLVVFVVSGILMFAAYFISFFLTLIPSFIPCIGPLIGLLVTLALMVAAMSLGLFFSMHVYGQLARD